MDFLNILISLKGSEKKIHKAIVRPSIKTQMLDLRVGYACQLCMTSGNGGRWDIGLNILPEVVPQI